MEARAEHPGTRRLTDPASSRLIGIDLGTTNSALAWSTSRGAIRVFDVPQLIGAGETGRASTLPSFLYFPDSAEMDSAALHLAWSSSPDGIAGMYARDHGALVPARQVASAKSWLSNQSVDRTAPLLPWLNEDGRRISPVEASARILAHLRDAWNHDFAGDDDALRLERQAIVLTVPASFDEEARELTVQAARDAGLEQLTLLEEPLAALYAWIAAHRRDLAAALGDRALVLVCDVGGGTTDFSLIRASTDSGELTFERIAIGEHLLLGGDNLDLALAALVEHKLAGAATKLSLTQRLTLRRKCSAAKEQLLSDPNLESVRITLLGGGRGVVGGGSTAELTREDVVRTLEDGFLPLTSADDLPARNRRVGLRELGLPYETEPAITRHLAAFLTRALRAASVSSSLDPSTSADASPRVGNTGGLARPDAVLFNGGFFAPAIARERVLDALTSWSGRRPLVLRSERPDAAVAIGAAFYAKLRRDPAASRRLLITAGTARAYYVGVDAGAGGASALCVMPRGTQEGARFALDRELTVMANQPAAFTLYSATDRNDAVNAIIDVTDEGVHRHAPLVTALRYGKRSKRVPLAARLTAVFTETGTLELWCESIGSEHRWRLSFNLRRAEADPLDDAAPEADGAEESDVVVVTDDAIRAGEGLIRAVFGAGSEAPPGSLVGDMEQALGHGKHAWPLPAIRRLADVLLDVVDGRRKGSAHEVRWLNLVGLCVRPGFGAPLDPWRVLELRKVYLAGLVFPKEIQSQVEWLVLWQRVGAGFNGGQQRELAQRLVGPLGVGQRKPPRVNPQVERETWRLLGSLERLDPGQRVKLGEELAQRIARDPRNSARLWALGRLGARTPLYGPLNSVVPAAIAERWIAGVLALKDLTSEAGAAVVQLGALTGDRVRDVSPEVRQRAIVILQAAGVDEEGLAPLRDIVPADRVRASRMFGESLPEGLRLEGEPRGVTGS
jgi:molecular chaperone DnaK (HSP70)